MSPPNQYRRASTMTDPLGVEPHTELPGVGAEGHGSRRFPLREAYSFAEQHGLIEDCTNIRDMEIEWDRNYTSTVRRGRMIELFERHELLSTFAVERWPAGQRPEGARELAACRRIYDEYRAFLSTGAEPAEAECPEVEEGYQFALEAHLRDFLADNLECVEPGMRLYTDEGRPGSEFPVTDGRIDLLGIDRDGKFVVIELKLSRGRNRTLGQILYYMGWVDKNLGNGPCRGIIIASDITDDLKVAVSRAEGVQLARYNMTFSIERA